ncbi:hypothetical protein [Corynebacterium sp. H113]|uniref:hypothetical protein n=1 Tax=Corynebacterium sp. H113 TaxID=3133419 RepID=UPI00309B248C
MTSPLPHIPQQSLPATDNLADIYRHECRDDIELAATLLRHPSASRRFRHEALNHSFPLPDVPGLYATVRPRRVAVPQLLVRELSLHYPEFLLIGSETVYLFSVSVSLDMDDGGEIAWSKQLPPGERELAVAQAMVPDQFAAYMQRDGIDPLHRAHHFAWLGTANGTVLPSPHQLFKNGRTAA